MIPAHLSFSIADLSTALDRDFNWVQYDWVYFFNVRQVEGVKNNTWLLSYHNKSTFDAIIFCLGLDQKGSMRSIKYRYETWCSWVHNDLLGHNTELYLLSRQK